MPIRTKVLLLLLVLSLTPLLVAATIDRSRSLWLGHHLASERGELLTADALVLLDRIVTGYDRMLGRQRGVIEQIVRFQAREVERALASAAPTDPSIYLSSGFDDASRLPPDIAPSTRHFRADASGGSEAIPVSLREQVSFVVRGVAPAAVGNDLARLSRMPEAYRFWREAYPELLYWQYTSLESGVHTSYPGHGGYPEHYDPRTRPWYTRARDAGGLVWQIMPEVSTRTVALTVAMPVRGPDGRFAGVTALDVPLLSLFELLSLPEHWAGHAEVMLVTGGEGFGGPAGSLAVLAHSADPTGRTDWERPIDLRFLSPGRGGAFGELLADAAAGRPGVKRLTHQDRPAVWAHGAGVVFPLVVVPEEVIRAAAAEARLFVTRRVDRAVSFTLGLAGLIALLVVVIAFLAARTITRPVAQLAHAAARLGQGDYAVTTDIRTRDEFGQLGRLFNVIGPQLHERERIKHSLAVAQEVQQSLLPADAPMVDGLDIAGHSVYCDETGGDYYDFLEVQGIEGRRVSVALGDVMGHGIAAAMLMATARGVLRSRCTQDGTLADYLAHLNDLLHDVTGGERFMTMLLAIVDPRSGTMRWSSAGHDTPFVFDPRDNRHLALEGGHLPLGVMPGERYEEAVFDGVRSGQVILFATDGLWEARGPAGQFGRQRVREAIAAAAGGTARQIADHLQQALRAHCGPAAVQEDDVTFVVIKVR